MKLGRGAVVAGAVTLHLAVVGAIIGLLARDAGVTRSAPQVLFGPQIPAQRPPESRVDGLGGTVHQPPSGLGWKLVDELSAHHVLIAEVETDRLHDAKVITQHLTEPVKEWYVEVLVYFYRAGRPRTFAAKRVQWTPATGYVETTFLDRQDGNAAGARSTR